MRLNLDVKRKEVVALKKSKRDLEARLNVVSANIAVMEAEKRQLEASIQLKNSALLACGQELKNLIDNEQWLDEKSRVKDLMTNVSTSFDKVMNKGV